MALCQTVYDEQTQRFSLDTFCKSWPDYGGDCGFDLRENPGDIRDYPPFDDLREELATVEIRQFFNRVESPTVGQVKVTETGLMDDSVRSIQTIYHFRKEEKNWKMHNTEKFYQCARGSNTKTFQKAACP